PEFPRNQPNARALFPQLPNGGDAHEKNLSSSGNRGCVWCDHGDGAAGGGARLRTWSGLRPCRWRDRRRSLWRVGAVLRTSLLRLLWSALLWTGLLRLWSRTLRLLRWAVLSPLLASLVNRNSPEKSSGL